MSARRKGKFIVLEGITSSGKSLQAKAVVAKLKELGYPAALEVEPTQGPFGRVIRAFIEKRPDAPYNEAMLTASTLLARLPEIKGQILSILSTMQRGQTVSIMDIQTIFMVDRFWHCVTALRERLGRGEVAICDRYELSTFAFGTSHGVELSDLLIRQHRILDAHYLEPDLVVYVRIPANVAIERLQKDGKVKDIFETEIGIKKTARAYEEIIDFGREHRSFGKIAEVDGNPTGDAKKSIARVTDSILAEILQVLK